MPGTGYGNDSIAVNCYMLPVPGSGADLRTVAYGVPKAANTLNGSRYRTYTSSTDAATDLAAGYISATTAAALAAAFSQTYQRPAKILVFNADLAGTEHYADTSAATSAIDQAILAGMAISTFFGICIQNSGSAENLKMSVWCEGHNGDAPHAFFAQSNDAGWYGATWPATYSTVQTNKWTAYFYHDGADLGTAPYALCVACAGLAPDPDQQSAGWRFPLSSVVVYTTPLTAAQKANALTNHVNLLTSLGTQTLWQDLGLNGEGRQISHLVSTAWLKYGLISDLQNLVISYGARRQKLPVNQAGAKVVEGIVLARANRGTRHADGSGLGHFTDYTDGAGTKYPNSSTSYAGTTITVTLNEYFENETLSIAVNAYLNEQ